MITVSAPGKTILHGEHSVVYGKAAIAVTVNLRTRVELEQTKNRETVALHLDHSAMQFYKEWNISDLVPLIPFSDEKDEIIAVTEDYMQNLRDLLIASDIQSEEQSFQSALTYLYLYSSITRKYKMRENGNICAKITSELPIGAGLGSSASYSVCLAAALLRLCGKLGQDTELKPRDLELINKWAFQAERILHGKPSGIDNSICTYGGALLFQNGEIKNFLRDVPQLKILLVNTRIPRNTKNLVDVVKLKREKYPSVINSVLTAMEQIALTQWASLEALIGFGGPGAEKTESLHDLLIMNQHLLNSLGVGHPKLDIICSVAENFGLAAKLTGAGGGGCAIVFLKDCEKFMVNKIKEKFIAEDFDVWEVGLACTGVTLD